MNKGKMMKNKNSFLVKLTVVAAMIGFFSPSVSINPGFELKNGYAQVPQLNISLWNSAEARMRSVNRNVNANTNVNRNVNSNVNVNRNVNVNSNVNVNHYYGGVGHYGYYGGRAIVAWSSAVVMGSMVAAASMPTTCTVFVKNGISYKQCGSKYYQPYYQGNTVVYKVVKTPL